MNKESLHIFKRKEKPDIEILSGIVPMEAHVVYTPLNNPPTDVLVVRKTGQGPFGLVQLAFDRVYYDLEIGRTFVHKNIDMGLNLHKDVKTGLQKAEQKLRKEAKENVHEARANRAALLRRFKKNK